MRLNYHHLRYFREVALEGNLTRAANRLNVSQSALSIQIKQLEERLGHTLFDRNGKRLMLTEAGRIAMDHADKIFGAGEDLLATLERQTSANSPLIVGAVSTLSRNFQIRFLEPLLSDEGNRLVLRSGDLDTLYADLSVLAVDLVLTTEPLSITEYPGFKARLIDRQPITLIGRPELVSSSDLRELLLAAPLIVPTDNVIGTGLARLAAQFAVTPNVIAEVDDMAMVRLLTRSGAGVALAPTVVLADELESGIVASASCDLGITEEFYAVTSERLFPHPLTEKLLMQEPWQNKQ